jgi:hypothetical protein
VSAGDSSYTVLEIFLSALPGRKDEIMNSTLNDHSELFGVGPFHVALSKQNYS